MSASSYAFTFLLCSTTLCCSQCVFSDEIEVSAHEKLETESVNVQLIQTSSSRATKRVTHDGMEVVGSDRRLPGAMPLAWVHVPKSGSTIINSLIRLPGACPGLIDTDEVYTMLSEIVAGTTNFESTFPDWPTLCPGIYSCSLDVDRRGQHTLGQHFAIGSLFEDAYDGHGFILLRQPEQRAISMYNYHTLLKQTWGEGGALPVNVSNYAKYTAGCAVRMLTRQHHLTDSNKSMDPSYFETLEVLGTADFVDHSCLRVNDNPSKAEVAEARRRLRAFVFVGITEQWKLSICLLHTMFGGKCHSSEFSDTRTQRNTSSSLYDTKELEGFVDQYDGALYEEALGLFSGNLARYDVSYKRCNSCFRAAGLELIDETDEDTTGVVTELPSEWRDKAQLSSLYHDLMLDDAWIPPTQKQLAQAMKQCDTFQKENRVGLTGEYKKWRAGEVPSYRDYTGWCAYPDKYIELLSTLYKMGLGEQSMVLEIGCGALSLGRLLIPFLARGHYHCIEPSRELIQDGIKFELGYDMLQRKLPSFAINAEFIAPPGLPESLVGSDAKATTERTTYDFMIANSIFTHTADDLFTTAMTNLRPRFASNARMLATIIFENWCGDLNHSQSLSSEASGWVYDRPFFVCHSPDHLTELLRAHGLAWEFAEQAGHQQFQAEVLIYPQGP